MADLKFSVDMNVLRKHVNFVRNGMGASKTDIPVMLMRFDVTGNRATIFCSNKEMFCRTQFRIDNDSQADGSFAILGEKVEKLIAQVEAERGTFEVDTENVQVHTGFLTVNFESYDGSVLKSIETSQSDHLDKEGEAVFKLALEEGLVCARSCTTANSIRPDVTHAEVRGGKVLSSDGRKIMLYEHESIPPGITLKVPAAMLTDVINAIKNMDTEHVQVFETGGYYYVKGNKNEYTFGVRKVERDFPAVENQLAAINKKDVADEISLDRNVFEGMLRGVALGLPSDEVKVVLEANGTEKEAYLEVSALNNLGRRSHERASCGRKLKTQISFPVSFRHLTETLSVFKGDSVVDMEVLDKKNMLLVRDQTDARTVRTIIPFRTDRQIEEEKKERDKADKAARTERDEAKLERDAAMAATEGAVEQDVDIV